MKRVNIVKIKKMKALFGVVTAVFSLAVAIQQIVQLNKGQTAQT